MKLNVKLTADELLNVLEAAEMEAFNRNWPVESAGEPENDICADIFAVMDAALSAMGIEVTEDADTEEVDDFGVPVDYDYDYDEDEDEDFDEEDFDFNDEEDEEEDDDDNDNVVYSLTVKGEFVLRYMEAGHPFEEACKVADILFGEGE